MANEAPLILKALRIVSIALMLGTVAVAATAGYSVYQEYNAISSIAGSQASLVKAGFTGSTLTLSGIQIPNNMTYPLSLDLLGNVTFQGIYLGSFDSGKQVVSPGQVKALSVNMTLDFLSVLKNSQVFEAILLNPSTLQIDTTISAGVIPLVGLNITKSSTTSLPPLLDNFAANLETSNAQLSGNYLLVPLALSWTNPTPITFTGTYNVTITSMPGQPQGNYGTGSGSLSLVTGQNQNTCTLAIPLSDVSGGSLSHGTYTFSISISALGNTFSFPESVNA